MSKDNNKKSEIPLCVDLDGTLAASDTLIESSLSLLRDNPWNLFILIVLFLKGKKYFKDKLDKYSKLNIAGLPFRQNVIDLIYKSRNEGVEVVLITASSQQTAEQVASHIKLFDKVWGSTGEYNLKGKIKSDFLIKKYGEKAFDYVGDSRADLHIWKHANRAILVEPSKSLLKDVRKVNNNILILSENKNKLKLFIREIRVYQWVKNLLLFLPMLMAHQLSNTEQYINVIIGFFAFGLTASAIYIINDLMDLDSDRNHLRKCKRPFASGDLPLLWGIIASPLFLITSFTLSFWLMPLYFNLILIIYFASTTLYTFYLKRLIIIDILTLAGLYSIRVIAGAFAAEVYISPWLLAFSMFIFLSLAIVKRHTELLSIKQQKLEVNSGRAYVVGDIDILRTIGISSGYLSILIFTLYINSKDVVSLYAKPYLLWAVVPLLLLWITRIWFLSERGKMHDDPIIFTVKDPSSYIIGLIIAILIIGASI